MNTDDSDRDIATRWHAASRDEPPAALDDAIRAAARREVGAGPSSSRRARHMRTWPLAAAAVMAVIAVGLLQLTPPDMVTPGAIDTDNVPARQLAKEAVPAAKNAPSPMVAGTTGSAEPAKPNPAVTVASNSDRAAAPAAKADAPVAAQTSTPPSAPAAAPKPAPAVDGARADERIASLDRKKLAQAPAAAPPSSTELQGGARMRDQSSNLAAGINNAPQTLRESDAKTKQETGAAESETRMAAKAQRAEPFPASPAQDKVAAAGAPAAPPMVAAAPPTAAMSRTAPAPTEATGALSARRDAAPAPMPEKLAKDTPLRPADEWIRHIRRLQTEGRNDDVLKELTAFRAAYKERADALLPPDLRALKP